MEKLDKKEYEEWLDTKELRKLIGRNVKIKGVDNVGYITGILITQYGIAYRVVWQIDGEENYEGNFSSEYMELL